MRTLDDKTRIPLGLAISLIGGAAIWLTTMHVNQNALARAMDEKEPVIMRMASDITEIKIQLARIEQKQCKAK